MIIGYGITFILSIGLLILYLSLVKNKEFWLSLLFSCITIVNLGYFMLSLAKSVEFAIFANDVAYLGSVFLSTCMFLTIVKLCGFTVKKRTAIILLSLGVVMFLIVATSGILPWYYKSVDIERINGATLLIKDYGVLHPLYAVYLGAYFVAMICAIVHSLIKKKGKTQKIAGFLVFIVFINIAVWFVEKFSKWEFEFLAVSYVVSELLFIFLYWTIQDYVRKDEVPAPEKTRVIVLDAIPKAEKIEKVLSLLPPDKKLTTRQMEMLYGILDGKSQKEIATELNISENTVKWHVRLLYDTLNVSGKDELFKLLKQN